MGENDATWNKMLAQRLPLASIAESGITEDEAVERLHDCREKSDAMFHSVYDEAVADTWAVEDLEVPLPSGGPSVRVKLHKPILGGKDLPLVIWAHGGGLTIMDYKDHYGALLFKPMAPSMCWASVDYTLTPGAKFPAPVNDVVATFEYFSSPEIAEKHGLNPSKLSIAGLSAGAYLAGQATRRLLLQGKTPSSLAMLYPMVRPTTLLAKSDPATKTDSFMKYGVLGACPGGWVEWCWTQTLGHADGTVDDECLKEADLLNVEWAAAKKLPTMLVVAKMDCLYDEGVLLGNLLKSAGLPLTFVDPAGSHALAHKFIADASKAVYAWWESQVA